ncbi:MAG: cupin domain-containing protein [Thermoplasmata archaeon]|nr:cupin domain-containing protein [Thermoplasmata archaeon]
MTREISRSSKETVHLGEKKVDGKIFRLLANTSGMRCVVVEMEPGKALEGNKSHKGEEFKYVLEGQVEFTVGEEKYVLGSGEWLWHKSETPHGARNPGQEKAKYITVVSRPAKKPLEYR